MTVSRGAPGMEFLLGHGFSNEKTLCKIATKVSKQHKLLLCFHAFSNDVQIDSLCQTEYRLEKTCIGGRFCQPRDE